MGLDMYLYASQYLSNFKDADKQKKKEIVKLFPELQSLACRGDDPIRIIKIEAGYWRKANHIHNWFVDNVQQGEDDCRPYFVNRQDLEDLRGVCQKVLDDKTSAELLLPTKSGFFFGSTEYGEYYFSDIEDTIKIIDAALSLPIEWDFEYQSSW